MPDTNSDKWQKRYEREKKARHQAEQLLEEKSSQLYDANQKLEQEVEVESSKYKREEEKFASLFRYSNDGIILQDHTGNIIDVNQAICDLLGKKRQQLIGTHISRVPSRDSISVCMSALRKVIKNGSARFECHLLDNHKNKIPVDVAATRLQFGQQTIIQGIIRDMSARHKASKDLEVATKTAIKANEAKSLFLATMSHEIRTPLNGIIGFTDILLQSKLSSEQQQHLSLIKKSGDILLNIINDILDFSRIESGHMELEQVDFNLTETIEDVLDIHAHTASSKQVDLLYYIDPSISSHIHGDSGRLKQVLLNLVSNGLKFTEDGAVSVEVKKLNSSFIQFSVTDSGIGFNQEIEDLLFQPFLQADASTTRKYGGTGLGLAICRQLAEAMGGYISASSVVGEGSEFTLTLPYQTSQDSYQEKLSTTKLKGKYVFVLDDNLINQDFLRARLKTWGCKSKTCSAPLEALAILEESPEQFDLMLIDMLMPDLDGFQFAKEFLSANPNNSTPMILVTSSREMIKSQVIEAGFTDLVYKPVKEKILLSSMLKAVDEKNHSSGAELNRQRNEDSNSASKANQPKKEKFALIVEDNYINARLAKLIIERLGVITHVAHNGQEALDALKDKKIYDVIFMDMQMPIMDGLEATTKIRKDPSLAYYKDIPIIAMTANVLPEDEARCLSAGMNNYITKPIDVEKVKELIKFYNV